MSETNDFPYEVKPFGEIEFDDSLIMTAEELEALLKGEGVPTIRFGVDA